ncbi:MAG: alanine--tRNA ligase [Dehalococcoidia bacterium]
MTVNPPFTGDEIRAAFLRFYQERGHLVMPSASLIPAGDPTLLLTSAGMVPFKPYYSGDEEPPSRRLASCQKCFRTTDIDEVGDRTHHTMFEMLGNFSIGDYFKRETIHWAWEFVTQVLQFDPQKLWPTVHYSDDEAFAIWRDEVGVDESRITRCGDEDNFWGPAGDEGACGPSSEIHYDFGAQLAPEATPCHNANDRFVEICNLVFPQFYQAKDGTRTLLPAPSIDTGMGLERVTAIIQGKPSAYETDLLAPIVQQVEGVSGKRYGEDADADFAIRVVTEHARSATFLIADGVVPSNEGRGYVLRRIIRRGIRFARTLGIEGAFLARVSEAVIKRMGVTYPELVEHRKFVLRSLEMEEERFAQAIALGMPVLDDMVGKGKDITAKEAFLLYDTYGFPLELTQEIAREQGLSVDAEGFEKEMQAQRERARQAARFGGGRDLERTYGALGVGESEFLGYATLEADTVIVGMLKDGQPVQRAAAGEEVEIVLRETPFYPEGGGQVGDTGLLASNGGAQVLDTQKPVGDIIVHQARVTEGELATGQSIHAAVDGERRMDIARNHTATHLLHAVLREVLGSHVRQAGSLVAPDRLRFDFTHVAALTPDELDRIERMVNDRIRGDLALVKREETHRDAMARGALAFFGERYGDVVRTIQIGEDEPVSFELCGGTHLDRTGQIGLFHILSETSVGTGIRRIEAVTGRGGQDWMNSRLALLDQVAAKLHATPTETVARIDALLQQVEEARKLAAAGQREASRQEAQALLDKTQDVGGITVLATRGNAADLDSLREMGDWLRDKMGSGVVVLGGVFNERPMVVAMVTQDLVDKGYSAGDIVRAAAKRMGGGGGGRPQAAQAGGKDPAQLDDALEAAVAAVRDKSA